MPNNFSSEFKKLKNDIMPRSEWQTLNREFLLKQISSTARTRHRLTLGEYGQLFTAIFRQQLFEPAVVMLLVLVTFLGSSLTINAAFYSLPGDQLYPLKLALEKTHVALTPDEEKKVELRIEFAQKRAAEFDKIVDQIDTKEVKKKKIEAVVKELKSNVASVNTQLQKISQLATEQDKEARVRMAVTVSSQTKDILKSLDATTEDLSDEEKSELSALVADAVATVQETGLSAQNVVDTAQTSESQESGTVEGVSADEPAATSTDATTINNEEENGETVEAQTTDAPSTETDAESGTAAEAP